MITACEKRERTDQGRTEACWIYAMMACIEHEQLRKGDSITLSRQWIVARALEEQTLRYHETRGEERVTMRNMGPEALRLIGRYGLVPYANERTDVNNSRVMSRKLEEMADRYMDRSADELKADMQELLPRFTIARDTHTFYFYGMRYDPMQFAESIMYDKRWAWYASDEEQPWNTEIVLEVKDNTSRYRYMNLPMKQLLGKVIQSLRNGHAVYWEYGDNHDSGHAMAIIGLKKGRDGKQHLLCLNSYGSTWGNKGRCLVSYEFFMDKTCNVGIIDQLRLNQRCSQRLTYLRLKLI